MRLVIRRGVARALVAALMAGTALAQEGSQTPADEKQRMTQLGLDHETARDLYEYFKQQANGGEALTWRNIPDWTGVWTREASPFFWDPDQTSTETLPPSVKLTPAYEQELSERVEKFNQGIDYDPLSMCNPAGMPRWLVEPFLREFIVTPYQVWLVNEMMNEIRRVYTDGRDHPSEADAYPLWEGDSIGFWDGDRLVIHTAQMRAGILQRIQPRVSEEVEVVEIWQKTADDTMVAHVWLYDPQAFEEPWYTKQVYKKLSNDDKSLRIRHWHCGENPNNVVIETDEGASDFADFTFTDEDDE
ncbi:MAG TPA: hypothetical protein VF322_07260 [Gammaproteobacteria bacterium]